MLRCHVETFTFVFISVSHVIAVSYRCRLEIVTICVLTCHVCLYLALL